MKWFENRNIFRKYKKVLKNMKCKDFKVSPPRGYLEILFGNLGRVFDEIFNPLILYSRYVVKHFYSFSKEFIETIECLIDTPEFKIRWWLYQKKRYLGWKND